MFKRIAITTLIILLVCAFAYLVFVIVSPLVLLSMEDKVLENELNNPYINADYHGWKSIEIEHVGDFMLPDQWSLRKNNDLYTITDSNGQHIAYGMILGDNVDSDTLFNSFIDYEIESISHDYASDIVSIDGSYHYRCQVLSGNTTTVFPCVILSNYTPKFILAFSPLAEIEHDSLQQIIQAIIYSYATL